MKRIKMSLDVNSINNAIRELQAYENSINRKTQIFLEKLMEVGIRTAKANTGIVDDLGNIQNLVSFIAQFEPTSDGCTAIMIASDITKIHKEWVSMEMDANGEGTGILFKKSADVSPLLMAEFGSGFEAKAEVQKPGYNMPSIGSNPQGTFPGQTHAFDPGGWSWMDIEGNWHHSKGITPTQPMYQAYAEMRRQIRKIAKEVFRED